MGSGDNNTTAMMDMSSTPNPSNNTTNPNNPNPNNNTANPNNNTNPNNTTPPCEGCIGSNGACFNGTLNSACGSGGTACVVCDSASGELCDENECVPPPPCSAESCDGCCNAAGECVTTASDNACGSGGGECVDCTLSDGTCTAEKTCKAPCGPENCMGCCDESGTCISGTTNAVCGGNGEACQACGPDEECEVSTSTGGARVAGECINTSCAATCDGCCDGDTCREGLVGEACGTGGAQCQDCGENSFCDDSQMCTPRSDVKWNLILLQGTFPDKKADGDSWDGPIGPNPDPFVEASYRDLATGDEITSSSSAASGNAPVWNETLFMGLTAEEIRSDLMFDYIEDDTAFNDVLGEDCAFADVNILFDEQPHVLVCGEERDANGMITYEGGTFSVKLEKSMMP